MNVKAFKEAQEAYSRGDYARALQGFTVCTQELGDLSAADLSKFYHLIGNCYIKNGEPHKAARYYQKALENSSKSRRPALYVNLGTALLNSRDYDNALKAFQAALSFPAYSTPYRAYSGIGAAQLKLGNTTEAGAAYREAALDPANPMPAKALVNLGVCFMELGRPADAIVSYETALDFDLDAIAMAKAKSNLGQAYMAEGRVQKAIDAFEDVIDGGLYELTPIARHDYDIACKLRDRLETKMPGILNTGFIPKLPIEDEEASEAEGEEADPFAPASVDTTEEFAYEVADPTGFIEDDPGYAGMPEAVAVQDAAEEPADDQPLVDEQIEQQPESEAETDGQTEEAEPEAVPAEGEPAQDAPVNVTYSTDENLTEEELANAQTAVFAPVDKSAALPLDDQPQPFELQTIGADGTPRALPQGDPAQTAEHAFAELDKEDDALPSPENTAFFDVTEKEIDTAAKDDMRKQRKRRGVGLKVAIAAVIICIILAAAAFAAYFMGYGFPTQEYVTEQFVAAAQAGEDTSQYWGADVDENTRATQVAILQNAKSCEVEAVERNMSHSTVYVKAQLEEGGEVYYEVVLGRNGIGWAVQYVELYFPSEQ